MKNSQLMHMRDASGRIMLSGKTQMLCETYEHFFNDYLSYATWADHNGMTLEQGKAFIDLARDVYNSDNVDY